MKNSFDNICSLITQFEERYIFDVSENVINFFATNTYGVALAVAKTNGWVKDIKGEGRDWVTETYQSLLDLMGVDDGDYDDIFILESVNNFEPTL